MQWVLKQWFHCACYTHRQDRSDRSDFLERRSIQNCSVPSCTMHMGLDSISGQSKPRVRGQSSKHWEIEAMTLCTHIPQTGHVSRLFPLNMECIGMHWNAMFKMTKLRIPLEVLGSFSSTLTFPQGIPSHVGIMIPKLWSFFRVKLWPSASFHVVLPMSEVTPLLVICCWS